MLTLVLAVLGLTLFQAGRTERAMQALRDLSSPRASAPCLLCLKRTEEASSASSPHLSLPPLPPLFTCQPWQLRALLNALFYSITVPQRLLLFQCLFRVPI